MTSPPVCRRCQNSEFEVRYNRPIAFTAHFIDGKWSSPEPQGFGNDLSIYHLACCVCGALNDEVGYRAVRSLMGIALEPLNYVVKVLRGGLDAPNPFIAITDPLCYEDAMKELGSEFGGEAILGDWRFGNREWEQSYGALVFSSEYPIARGRIEVAK